jgi:hypothetical protein
MLAPDGKPKSGPQQLSTAEANALHAQATAAKQKAVQELQAIAQTLERCRTPTPVPPDDDEDITEDQKRAITRFQKKKPGTMYFYTVVSNRALICGITADTPSMQGARDLTEVDWLQLGRRPPAHPRRIRCSQPPSGARPRKCIIIFASRPIASVLVFRGLRVVQS